MAERKNTRKKPAAKPKAKQPANPKKKTAPKKAAPKTIAKKPDTTPANKGGRPTSFTPMLGRAICKLIADGYSLKEICEHEKMPSKQSVFNWLFDGRENENDVEKRAFFDQYARAREAQGHLYADELRNLTKDQKRYWLMNPDTGEIMRDSAGLPIPDPHYAARLRTESDNLKWMAGKLAPKVYGDKVNLDANVTQKTEFPPHMQEILSQIMGKDVEVEMIDG